MIGTLLRGLVIGCLGVALLVVAGAGAAIACGVQLLGPKEDRWR